MIKREQNMLEKSDDNMVIGGNGFFSYGMIVVIL